MSVLPWALQWLQDTDDWRIITLDLAEDDPARAMHIRESCSFLDVAEAWVNSKRKTEGIGYKIKEK